MCARIRAQPLTQQTWGSVAGTSQLDAEVERRNGFKIAAGYACPCTGRCAVDVISKKPIFLGGVVTRRV
jgi:hypothetical protein